MNDLLLVYGTYTAAVIGLTTWLARTLFTNGAVFLRDVFPDRTDLAEAVNRLLVTGFAMLNLGYGFFLLRGGRADNPAQAFEVLANKLGILLVSLAVIHFVNLAVFHRIAARSRQSVLVPPVAPQAWVDDGPVSTLPAPPAAPGAPAPSGWAR
jgi:hypothetical protein